MFHFEFLGQYSAHWHFQHVQEVHQCSSGQMSIIFTDGSNSVGVDSSHGSSWPTTRELTFNCLWILCHLLMLELLRDLSPKAVFSNTILSLGIFPSHVENSMQTCWLVFKFISLHLEQHPIPRAPFLYRHIKITLLFIVRRSFWCWTMQKTFVFLRILSLYVYHWPTFPLPPPEDTRCSFKIGHFT